MSKKNKRQFRPVAGGAASPDTATAASSMASNAAPSFNPNYAPVIKDLRRIGVLAGVFVSLLVILSFFLR